MKVPLLVGLALLLAAGFPSQNLRAQAAGQSGKAQETRVPVADGSLYARTIGRGPPTIVLHGGGLATSSTTVRHWRSGDEDVHHLIDPATGRSVRGAWRTVTVAAASCVQANVATTAAIVRGDRGLAWLESLKVPARLVAHDGTVVHTDAWPRDAST